jgi:hypothetical protein
MLRRIRKNMRESLGLSCMLNRATDNKLKSVDLNCFELGWGKVYLSIGGTRRRRSLEVLQFKCIVAEETIDQTDPGKTSNYQ